MGLRSSVVRILSAAGPTLERFWVPVALTVALTITSMLILDVGLYGYGDPGTDLRLNRIRLASALVPAILASWCTLLFWERKERHTSGWADSQVGANLAALLTAFLVAWATHALLPDFTLVPVSRHIAICLFLALMFFVIPHFRKQGSLEMYIVKLFSHTVVSVLFSAVMFLGLSAILLTISSLFSLTIGPRAYQRLWLTIAGVMGPFLFMAGIPEGTVDGDPQDYSKVLKNLILFVVTPLLAAYTAILYVYFAKILITRQWPVGLVAHLVLWYALVNTALLYFLWPLSQDNRWAHGYSSVLPKAVTPLLLMMFASVGIRIKHYGITENRYYVLVLGLWVLASMVYLMVAKDRKRLILPASLAMVVLLSVFGPWSSFKVSMWSQNNRLESLLNKYGMLSGERIEPTTQPVNESDKREIAEVLFYFDRNHDLSDVRFIPQGFTMADFPEVFGFAYGEAPFEPAYYLRYAADNRALNVDEYQCLFDYTEPRYDEDPVTSLVQGNISAKYNRDRQTATVVLDDKVEWEASLSEYVSGLEPVYDEYQKSATFAAEDMVLKADTPHLRIKLIITEMWGQTRPNEGEGTTIEQVQFYLLVGLKT
ncbi:MAG: DUF4153 domain-containing protein [Bacillota bacterium]|jgi:hypothetical protein